METKSNHFSAVEENSQKSGFTQSFIVFQNVLEIDYSVAIFLVFEKNA